MLLTDHCSRALQPHNGHFPLATKKTQPRRPCKPINVTLTLSGHRANPPVINGTTVFLGIVFLKRDQKIREGLPLFEVPMTFACPNWYIFHVLTCISKTRRRVSLKIHLLTVTTSSINGVQYQDDWRGSQKNPKPPDLLVTLRVINPNGWEFSATAHDKG